MSALEKLLQKQKTIQKQNINRWKKTPCSYVKYWSRDKHNDACVYTIGDNISKFKIRFNRQINENNVVKKVNEMLISGNYTSTINNIDYLVTFTDLINRSETPEKRKEKKRIRIIETKLFYDNFIKPVSVNKPFPSFLENITKSDEFIYFTTGKYKENNVAWTLCENKFVLLPSTYPLFPIFPNPGRKSIFGFPWKFVCYYLNKERRIYSIRELENEDIHLLEKLKSEIIQKLTARFFDVNDKNICIYSVHNIESIRNLSFEVSILDNNNLSKELKWRTDSRILLDEIIDLLKEDSEKFQNRTYFYPTLQSRVDYINFNEEILNNCLDFFENSKQYYEDVGNFTISEYVDNKILNNEILSHKNDINNTYNKSVKRVSLRKYDKELHELSKLTERPDFKVLYSQFDNCNWVFYINYEILKTN